MVKPLTSSLSRVLLVEGRDDEQVVKHLEKKLELNLDFKIKEKGGWEPLCDSIKNEIREEGHEIIGIILDANASIQDRWKAVANRLKEGGVKPPNKPCSDGTIIPETDDNPRVGIWLMPDNESQGELENFIECMIPEKDSIWPLAKGYVDGIPEKNRLFGNKIVGARVHAWLAVQEDPRRMGLAIKTGDLKTDTEIAQRFVKWLTKLFAE